MLVTNKPNSSSSNPKAELPADLIERGQDLKLACFDIDGTVLPAAHQVTPGVRAAIELLHANSVKVAIASGRPSFAISELVETLGVNAPCSLFAGALIYNPLTRERHFEVRLSEEAIAKLIDYGRNAELYLELYTSEKYVVEQRRADFAEIHHTYLKVFSEVAPFDRALLDQGIIKGVIVLPKERCAEHVKALQELLPDCIVAAGFGAAHKEIMFINIISSAASRDITFQKLIELQGIRADQVISFGDSDSDKEFVKAAGIGIALENASPGLKAVADFVTTSVEEDGVAKVINAIFAGKQP